MSILENEDRIFKPQSERVSVPVLRNLDPLKEGMPMRDPDPVARGIKKQSEKILSAKSIGDFMALRGNKMLHLTPKSESPQLGKIFEISAAPPLSASPVFPTPPGSCGSKVEIADGPTPPLSTKHKIAKIQERLHQPSGSRPSDEKVKESQECRTVEPKSPISTERLVFLERLEKIMASEARMKEIEAENKTLIGMVTRLQNELDDLKTKESKKL